MLKRIAQGIFLLFFLLLVVWFTSPWWLPPLAQSLAGDAGLDEIRFDVSRPTHKGISLPQVEVISGEFTVTATDVDVVWSMASLRASRIDSLKIGELMIQQKLSVAPAQESENTLDSGFIPGLPVDHVDAPRVVFHSPHLPLRLEGGVQLAERRIDLDFKATESPANVPVSIGVTLNETGEFQAQVKTSDAKDVYAVEARGAVRSGKLSITGSLDFGDYELGLLTGLVGLTPMGGTLTGPIEATFDDASILETIRFEPRISLQATSEQGRKRRFSMAGTVSYAKTSEDSVVQLDLADTSKSRSTRVNLTIMLSDAQVKMEGSWGLSRSDFSSLTALLDLPELTGRGSGVVAVESLLPVSLATLLVDATLQIDLDYAPSTRVSIKTARIRHIAAEPWAFELAGLDFLQDEGGVKTTFAAASVEGSASIEDSLTLQFSTEGVATWADKSMTLTLEGLKATGHVQQGTDGWQGQLALLHRDYPLALDFKADGSFERIDYSAALDLTLREPLLATTLKSPQDYDVFAGQFTGSLEGRMRGDDLSLEVQGAFNRGRLRYDEYEANDVSATVNYRLNAGESTLLRADSVRIGKFDPGVPMTDIRTAIVMNDVDAEVAPVSAALLGGTIHTTAFTFALEAGTGAFDVGLRGIDLGAVLALEGEDLNGTGTLEGSLPIVLSAEGVQVNKGSIRTIGPGVIRIAPSLTRVVEQPGLDFALKALEDFSYSSLEAEVDYNVKGDLLAAIRLKGRNPAIEKGRPIHYNLNVSENIPSLLASLRIQDDVNERIERRLRERAGLPK